MVQRYRLTPARLRVLARPVRVPYLLFFYNPRKVHVQDAYRYACSDQGVRVPASMHSGCMFYVMTHPGGCIFHTACLGGAEAPVTCDAPLTSDLYSIQPYANSLHVRPPLNCSAG